MDSPQLPDVRPEATRMEKVDEIRLQMEYNAFPLDDFEGDLDNSSSDEEVLSGLPMLIADEVRPDKEGIGCAMMNIWEFLQDSAIEEHKTWKDQEQGNFIMESPDAKASC